MNWWKSFLKLRKQNDAVKIALLMILAAVGFFAGAVYRGVMLYRLVNAPVEYILTGTGDLSEIEALEGVVAVSTQKEQTLTVLYRGKEYPLSYTVLSEDYLRDVFGIHKAGATQTFYMNRAAYRQFGSAESKLLVSCAQEEADSGSPGASGSLNQTTARLLLTETILEKEQPQAFAIRTAPDMQTQNQPLRVCFQKRDLDGSQIKQLENLGFMLADREAQLPAEYEKKELLLRLKYEAGIGILCLIAAGALNKAGIVKES